MNTNDYTNLTVENAALREACATLEAEREMLRNVLFLILEHTADGQPDWQKIEDTALTALEWTQEAA